MSTERGSNRPAKYDPRLDRDTNTYGFGPPFEPWEADGTGMVHVLWSAKHRGLTLEKDCDEIATMVMRSRWLRAQQHFAGEVSA